MPSTTLCGRLPDSAKHLLYIISPKEGHLFDQTRRMTLLRRAINLLMSTGSHTAHTLCRDRDQTCHVLCYCISTRILGKLLASCLTSILLAVTPYHSPRLYIQLVERNTTFVHVCPSIRLSSVGGAFTIFFSSLSSPSPHRRLVCAADSFTFVYTSYRHYHLASCHFDPLVSPR